MIMTDWLGFQRLVPLFSLRGPISSQPPFVLAQLKQLTEKRPRRGRRWGRPWRAIACAPDNAPPLTQEPLIFTWGSFLVFPWGLGAAKFTLYRQVLVCASGVSTRSWSKFLCLLVIYDVSTLKSFVVAHAVCRPCRWFRFSTN